MAENEIESFTNKSTGIEEDTLNLSQRLSFPSAENRKKQVITFAAIKNKTYGGPDFIITAHSSSGLPVIFTAAGACSITGNEVHIEKAGQCTITAHQDGDNRFDPAIDVFRTFTVNPARLIVSADNKAARYGAVTPDFSATLSGIVNGDTLESLGNLVYSTNATPESPAGTYTITPGGLGSANYDIEYMNGKLSVLPAAARVIADDKTINYSEPLPEFSATISGLVNGDTPDTMGKLSFLTTAMPDSSIGIYSIVPEGLSCPNYTFEYFSGKLHIVPANVKVIAEDKNVVYGEPMPEFTARIYGMPDADTSETREDLKFVTAASQGSPVGSYSIVPEGLPSYGYSVEYINGKLEIVPATLQIAADDKKAVYGAPLPEFSASISGLVNGDTLEQLGQLSVISTAKRGSPVGSYLITPSGMTSVNYTIEYYESKLEIIPAELRVKANDKSIGFGDPLPEFDATITGLVEGDTAEFLEGLSFNVTAKKGSPLGTYSIKPSGMTSANYAIEYYEGKLEIIPAVMQVKANDKSIIYGEPLPEFDAAVTGLVEGETAEYLEGLSFDVNAKKGSPAGIYQITPRGINRNDYSIEYITGKLEILPAILKIKADDKSVVIGGKLPEFTLTASGLIEGDTIDNLGILTFRTDAKEDSPAGSYSIRPQGLVSPNYSYVYTNGTLNILPLSNAIEPPVIENTIGKKIEDALSASVSADKALVKKPRLGEVLVSEGKITNDELAKALSKQLDVPIIDMDAFQIEPDALKLVAESAAKQYGVIPLAIRNGYLIVAMSDPTNIMAIEAMTALTKMRVKPLISTPEDIKKAIDRNYKSMGELEKQFVEVQEDSTAQTKILDEQIAAAPAVRALDIIVEEAIKNRASDIHIEPQLDKVRIRYRIDGVLHEVSFLPYNAHGPLISRLKVLSEMNIADHRPQDGQFSFKAWDKEVDIRVATIATTYGEMATLRILDKSYAVRTLQGIGFSSGNLEKFGKMLKSPFGMILVSGPTGSGKTTTLYASINSLDCKEMKIITIEDPVEYHFDGINQIQVNPRAGLTFSDGLRSIMRHDPDVALVGEIRDQDTSSVAVQAAMTGHLVLASVHANDTVGVIFRLMDLGVEPFLLSTALVGILAQRMVRKVCPHCQQERDAAPEYQAAYFDELGESRDRFYYGKGCELCSNTGYLGRTAVMEILTVSDEIKKLILAGAGNGQIRAQAIKEGMVSMRHDGMLKVKEGITTPNEVLKNVINLE